MPPGPRLVPASPQPDAAERRLHIHGIEEMPAGYDAEVAELFRDLRAASALSETDLVQLRPKPMPDVPVMTPPDNSDFAFQPGNQAVPSQAAPSGRSPLDIEW